MKRLLKRIVNFLTPAEIVRVLPEPTTLEYRNAQWRGEFYAKFYSNMHNKE